MSVRTNCLSTSHHSWFTDLGVSMLLSGLAHLSGASIALALLPLVPFLIFLETLQKPPSSLLNLIKRTPSYGSMGLNVQLKSLLGGCFKLVPWGTLVLRISVFAPFMPYIHSNDIFVFEYESCKFYLFLFQ